MRRVPGLVASELTADAVAPLAGAVGGHLTVDLMVDSPAGQLDTTERSGPAGVDGLLGRGGVPATIKLMID